MKVFFLKNRVCKKRDLLEKYFKISYFTAKVDKTATTFRDTRLQRGLWAAVTTKNTRMSNRSANKLV